MVALATFVSLIGKTTSEVVLRIRSEIDDRRYSSGGKMTDAQIARL